MTTRLESLAVEIGNAHRAFLATASTALEHARHAGELLIEAKGQLEHGVWLPWLRANCDLSVRVAQGYMRIARRWPELQAANTKRDSYLPIRDALTILADEWTDADDLGSGGADDNKDQDDHDDEDDDDNEEEEDDDDEKNGNKSQIRQVQLFLTVATIGEFKRQVSELGRAFGTTDQTAIVVKAVHLVYASLADGRELPDETDAYDSVDDRPVVGR